MNYRYLTIGALLLALLFLGACAANRTQDQRALLRAELLKWENFTSEGVAQVSYNGLALRKMFVLSKTRDEARLDVLDGGALGINPEPLVSAYLGDYFSLKAPIAPQLELLAQNSFDPGISLQLLSNPDSLLQRYAEEIISTKKLALDSVELTFNPSLQLMQISTRDAKTQVDISYTKKGDPDKVLVQVSKNTSLELLVDEISYGNAELTPLPPNQSSPLVDKIMEALEQFIPQEGDR